MKYLKKFNEAIIDWESDNIKEFYKEALDKLNISGNPFMRKISFTDLKEIGDKHDVEVVDYDTFYKELPSDKTRSDAPPKGQIPIFGLFNFATNKVRLVIQTTSISERDLKHAYHILKHENIHLGQKDKRKDNKSGEFLGDIRDTKSYFSNKEEVMAFAQSVSDEIMGKSPETLDEAIKMLNNSRLYKHIKVTVEPKILQRYKKYIYLYLESEFDKIKNRTQ